MTQTLQFWWPASVVLMVATAVLGTTGGRRVGLVATVLANYGLLYWLGAGVFLLPVSSFFPQGHASAVESGFFATALCLSGFCLGALSVRAMIKTQALGAAPPRGRDPVTREISVLALALFTINTISPWRVTSLEVLLEQGGVVFFACLMLQLLRTKGGAAGAINSTRVLIALALYGTFMLLGRGFLGYTVIASIPLACGLILKRGWTGRAILMAPVVIYLGLTLFVNYMGWRGEFRDQAWGRGARGAAAEVAVEGVKELSLLDLSDPEQASLIDGRLNQSWLVGLGVARLTSGKVDLIGGESLIQAAVVWIPRAVWPSKPVYGGSGDLVSRATGVKFAEGTSIGVGLPLELLMSVGLAWAVAVFGLMGMFVEYLDRRAAIHLIHGRAVGFLRCVLAGLPLALSIDNLASIVGTIWASLVLLWTIDRSRRILFRRR